MIDRIVNTTIDEDDETQEEQQLENTLRPKDFSSYIGQQRLKTNLKLAIDAAKKRGDQMHYLPPMCCNACFMRVCTSSFLSIFAKASLASLRL